MLKIYTKIVVFALILCSCSSNSGLLSKFPEDVDVDLVSKQEVVKQDILSHPTKFKIPFTDDRDSWARTRYFFQTYTKGNPRITDIEFISDEEFRDQRYSYHVLRVPINIDDAKSRSTVTKEYEYTVSCYDLKNPVSFSNTKSENVKLRAKNLARFIKGGQLELTLLKDPA